jgi:hypothetical protein
MKARERIKPIQAAGFAGEGLDHVQIRHCPGTLDFAGKRGWLRHQSYLQHSDCLEALVEKEFGIPIAGEWMIGDDDKATARLTIEEGVQTVRIIEERAPVDGPDEHWQDVLAESVSVYSRTVKQGDDSPLELPNYAEGQINHRVYYGFRDEADAENGNIRRLAERMTGWTPEEEAK